MGNGSNAVPRGSGEREASHRWKVLGVGFAANASFSAAFSGIPTTAVFLRSSYHLSNHGLGLVLGMLGLGIAVSELPWGLLTDRWGARRVLLPGLLSTAAALAGLALGRERVGMARRRLHGARHAGRDEPRRHGAGDRQYLCVSHALPDAARDSAAVVHGFVADGVGGGERRALVALPVFPRTALQGKVRAAQACDAT
ncbi:hypothetical protein LMG28614_04833 [Paraburkholderia ultramafica]|uniref:Major facilitator superfamily (MFS) profile domain-containing protein n=1 Tax=Paraburkholderia ultramafica TaxID=1544867 RepID=A0A6S7BGG4_9BURK|nr:hypothetical protein LMG28614_04833 [Paraburkholderia ultramafica]